MRVIWTNEALQDRADVWDYMAADNPQAVVRMDELFSDAAARHADHPKLVRHESYRLVYEISGDTL